jgi:pimeloyl-ACP methyl ester carboxylesterase
MARDRESLAQRSQERLYFDHEDMDYYFSWILGREIYDGSQPTECFDTAARIVNGEAASWQRGWANLAPRVEDRAYSALGRGDVAGARAAYLQACTYYRAPLFMMKPQDAAFHGLCRKMRSCFQKAAGLFAPPIEPIEVPFGGEPLPGYFWKVDNSGQRRPTLIVIGGIETFAEDCYFMSGPSGLQRGYNVMTVDLPGQGVNPERGLFFGARMESPIEAVLDYAGQHPEIDARRLAIFGFSWGGHIVFKGGQHDQRIRAMIANPPMPNVFRAVLAQQKGHDRNDPIARIVFEQIAWRMGLRISLNVRDVAGRVAKAYDYLVHGRADPRKISCPTLCLAGEGEAPITLEIARECVEQLPHPMKQLRIFTKEEGGEAHCQVDNPALPNRVMFDWLDEVFSGGADYERRELGQ